MKLNVFMSIAAFLAALFGLAFLLAPVQTMAVYGVTLDISGQFIARYLGGAFLGIAVIGWSARNANPKDDLLQVILLGFFVMTAVSFVAAIFDALSSLGSNLVWSTVIIYLFLAIGFGYFRFIKSS